MTGESWSEAIVRPLIFGLYDNAITVALFYVTFILLTQMVLTNVVVAVLLDKFVADPDGSDGDSAAGGLQGGSVDADAGSSFLEAVPPAGALPSSPPRVLPCPKAAPLEDPLEMPSDRETPYQVEAMALESSRVTGYADPSVRLEALEASVEGLRLSTRAMQTSLEALHAKLDKMLVPPH